MDPSLGRIAFRLGIMVLSLSILPLFIIDWNSAEFVVDVIAILISVIFLVLVSWDVRRQVEKTMAVSS